MLTRIGNVEIWRILESVDPFLKPHEFFPDMGDDGLELLRRDVPRQICTVTGMMLIPIQGFLIKTPRHVVLVDACVGNDKTCQNEIWHKRSDNRFMAGLTAAGVSPADVDFVLCTHLHLDHVGWNTKLENGQWVPTFPKARYVMPSEDHTHFSANPDIVYNESVLPVIAAGQAELVTSDHMLGDYISLIPTAGHTPGHVSVRVADAGQEAIISGDAIHSPIQCIRPEWNFAYDLDKQMAATSRLTLLGLASENNQLLVGSHFPLPSFGRVRAANGKFSWVET